MYEWIWRHLPFGLPGKIMGSLVLVAAVVAVLWFKVFAMVEPLLPNTDGQVTQGGASSSGGSMQSAPPAGSASPSSRVPGGITSTAPAPLRSSTADTAKPRSAQPSR